MKRFIVSTLLVILNTTLAHADSTSEAVLVPGPPAALETVVSLQEAELQGVKFPELKDISYCRPFASEFWASAEVRESQVSYRVSKSNACVITIKCTDLAFATNETYRDSFIVDNAEQPVSPQICKAQFKKSPALGKHQGICTQTRPVACDE